MTKLSKIIGRRTLSLQIPRHNLEKAITSVYHLRDCNEDDLKKKIENASAIPHNKVPSKITDEFKKKGNVFYKKDGDGVFYVIRKTGKDQQEFFISAHNPELKKEKPLSDTVRILCKRRGRNGKGYSVLKDGKIICRVDDYTLRPKSLQNKKCLWQEKRRGATICLCNDVKSEYDAEWSKANENEKKQEAFDIYNWEE